jgi:hypothetical protein
LARFNLISSRLVFFATIIIVPTILLIVYFTGLEDHRSLYQNSLITTTILSVTLFGFTFCGLYLGWKLKETMGNFKNFIPKAPSRIGSNTDGMDALELGEGVEGCLISLLLWIVIGLFGSLILWAIGVFFWGVILLIAALLYWVIFRAFRLIFRNSIRCKGKLLESMRMSILYTILYVSWIYLIIIGGHYLKLYF